MAMDAMSRALEMAFGTALLLTGKMRTAEAAVIHGIGCCEDLSPRGLLIETVRFALRRGTITANAPYEVGCFPPELQALFMLQPLSRQCFVRMHHMNTLAKPLLPSCPEINKAQS